METNSTFEEAKNRFFKIVESNNSRLIGDYTGTKSYHQIECQRLHIFRTTPKRSFYSKRWCLQCVIEDKKLETEQAFRKKASDLEFVIKSEYVDIDSAIMLECKFGHCFMGTPRRILKKLECGTCWRSQGEILTEQVLRKLVLFLIFYLL